MASTPTDILKHTPKQNPDAKCLEDALTAIKEIMTYINEDKRKTEGQLAMFDIFNEIENCPVSAPYDLKNSLIKLLYPSHRLWSGILSY